MLCQPDIIKESPMKFVHVQSVLPEEDVIALKKKAHESSIKDAIAKAVYHYLKCDREV